MKKTSFILFAFAIFLGMSLGACKHSHDHDGHGHEHEDGTEHVHENEDVDKSGKEYTSKYICPMHCEGSGASEAGTCPVCGMDYVINKKYKGEEGDDHSGHDHGEEGDDHDHDH
jgi:hypothetical protein